MKSTPKVSILIPVFNMEQFLARALESACKQSFRDIEIICVDDCSTDGSVKILEDFAARDGRIRIVRHGKNLGLLATRETAVREARGEYVMHLDSDDELILDIVEKSYDRARETAADIVHFSALLVTEDSPEGKLLTWASPKQKDTLSQPDMTHQLLLGQIGHNCWGKLFRRSLYCRAMAQIGPEMLAKKLTYEEDLLQCSVLFSLAKKYVVLDSIGYRYYKRAESESHKIHDTPSDLLAALNDYFSVVRFLNGYLDRQFLRSLSAASIPPFSHYVWKKDFLRSEELAGAVKTFLGIYHESERWLAFAYLFDRHRENFFEVLPFLHFPPAKPANPVGQRRVAFILPNRTEQYLLAKTIDLANGLAARGSERVALIIGDPIQTKLRPIADGIEIFMVNDDLPYRVRDFFELLQRETFDVIVQSDTMSLRTHDDVVLLKLLGNRVVVMDHHSYLRNIHYGNPNFNCICRKLYAVCDAVVCGQKFDEFLWRLWVNARTLTIPAAVPAGYQAVGQPAKRQTRDLILVGPFEQNWHRQHLAIEMFPRILAKFPDVRLKLVGPLIDEGYVRWCIGRIGALGINRSVEILGSHANLSEIYGQATLNLLTSSFESEDEPFTLAKAYSLPTVLFRLDSLDIARTEDCIAVDRDSPSEMAEAIIDLLSDPDRCEELSRKARQNLPHVSMETVIGRWVEVLMAVVDGDWETLDRLRSVDFDGRILSQELLNEANSYLPLVLNGNRRLAGELEQQSEKFQEDLKVAQAKEEMLNATIADLQEKLRERQANGIRDDLPKHGKIRSLLRSLGRRP